MPAPSTQTGLNSGKSGAWQARVDAVSMGGRPLRAYLHASSDAVVEHLTASVEKTPLLRQFDPEVGRTHRPGLACMASVVSVPRNDPTN